MKDHKQCNENKTLKNSKDVDISFSVYSTSVDSFLLHSLSIKSILPISITLTKPE